MAMSKSTLQIPSRQAYSFSTVLVWEVGMWSFGYVNHKIFLESVNTWWTFLICCKLYYVFQSHSWLSMIQDQGKLSWQQEFQVIDCGNREGATNTVVPNSPCSTQAWSIPHSGCSWKLTHSKHWWDHPDTLKDVMPFLSGNWSRKRFLTLSFVIPPVQAEVWSVLL